MSRPLHAIVDEIVIAETELARIRTSREAALALLIDADGHLDRAKARCKGLREELDASVRRHVDIERRTTHAA